MSDLVMALMLMARSAMMLNTDGAPPTHIEVDPASNSAGVMCGGERHAFNSDAYMMVSDGSHVLVACWAGLQ